MWYMSWMAYCESFHGNISYAFDFMGIYTCGVLLNLTFAHSNTVDGRADETACEL